MATQAQDLIQGILDLEIYYNVFYQYYTATVAAPFILAIVLFYTMYAI